jgi:hypothetical protein
LLALDCSSAREQTAVDGIHNRRCVDHSSAKVSAVETFDRVLAALDLVKLEVDVAGGVGVDGDVDNVSVLLFGFLSNIIF